MSENLITAKDMETLSIEDLMDAQLNEIEEVQDFILYPEGIYVFEVKTPKIVSTGSGKDKKQSLEFLLSPMEVVETKNDEDQALAEKILETKQDFSTKYFPGYGFQELSTRWKAVSETLGLGGSIGDLRDNIGGTIVRAQIKHRKGKADSNGERPIYPALREISVAE